MLPISSFVFFLRQLVRVQTKELLVSLDQKEKRHCHRLPNTWLLSQ